MSQILKYTRQYADLLKNTYDEIKILNNKIKTTNPNSIRNIYDQLWNITEKKVQDTDESLE